MKKKFLENILVPNPIYSSFPFNKMWYDYNTLSSNDIQSEKTYSYPEEIPIKHPVQNRMYFL